MPPSLSTSCRKPRKLTVMQVVDREAREVAHGLERALRDRTVAYAALILSRERRLARDSRCRRAGRAGTRAARSSSSRVGADEHQRVRARRRVLAPRPPGGRSRSRAPSRAAPGSARSSSLRGLLHLDAPRRDRRHRLVEVEVRAARGPAARARRARAPPSRGSRRAASAARAEAARAGGRS